MGDTLKYWDEQDFQNYEKETLSEDVQHILDLFRLLSAEERLKVKQLVREEKIF